MSSVVSISLYIQTPFEEVFESLNISWEGLIVSIQVKNIKVKQQVCTNQSCVFFLGCKRANKQFFTHSHLFLLSTPTMILWLVWSPLKKRPEPLSKQPHPGYKKSVNFRVTKSKGKSSMLSPKSSCRPISLASGQRFLPSLKLTIRCGK